MCVPIDSELPDLGLIWPLPSGASVALTTTDGCPFRTFVAQAVDANGTGFVVLPDVRGLFSFYQRLTKALASVGFDAIAIDYFGRFSGIEPRHPDDDPWPALDVYTAEQASDDVGVAIAHLRESLGVEKVIVLASSARRVTLHLPTGWPWESAWSDLFNRACGPPPAPTT